MFLPITLTKLPKQINILDKAKSMKRKGHSKPKPEDELKRKKLVMSPSRAGSSQSSARSARDLFPFSSKSKIGRKRA